MKLRALIDIIDTTRDQQLYDAAFGSILSPSALMMDAARFVLGEESTEQFSE